MDILQRLEHRTHKQQSELETKDLLKDAMREIENLHNCFGAVFELNKSLRDQLANIRSAIPKREYPPFLKVETLAHEALYLVEQVETYRDECEAIRTKLAEAEKRAEVAEAREASLLEAVTASAETKRAYTSEFSIGFPEFDSENDEYMRKSIVPWITIKEIMRVIKDRAIAARQDEGGGRL